MSSRSHDDQLLVRDLEADGQPIVGVYLRTDEDAVIYEDADGKLRQAPDDCVRVEPFAVTDAPCECSPVDRILADNDPANGSTADRIIAMSEGRCNGCGGRRP